MPDGADQCATQNCEHLKRLSMNELQKQLEQKFDDITESTCNPEEIAAYLHAMDDIQPLNLSFDTEALLKEFHEKHVVLLEQKGKSIPTDIKLVSISPRQKAIRIWIAAAIAILLTGVVVAQAMGVDLLSVIASWTKDVFHYTTSENGGDEQDDTQPTDTQFKDLQSALEAYGVQAEVVPTWIPEGYSLEEVNLDASKSMTVFNAYYTNNEKSLTVFINYHESDTYFTFEKDERPVTVYEQGGITHYIMTNNSQYTAIWLNGNLECSIFGDVSKEDMIHMIDSITGGRRL
jgi:hypothetical protein